jgi:lipopolysaccharide biosynthesis glycosyltransferase
MFGNIIVTAADRKYFDSLRTLISSIHKHSYEVVDKIIVYDIGLDPEEVKRLNNIEKVCVKEFSNIEIPYKHYLLPKGHAYKLYCVYEFKQLAKNILWLDAGVMLLKDIHEIFNIIELEDIFLVGDVHLNKNYTKKACIQAMNATENELNDTQLSSGILGYKSNGKYQKLIDEAFEYSKIEDCVVGDEENHRHDQSVYSILASRYSCKKHDINKYGYWTDSSRNLHTAMENDAVIFVHRRGHHDISNIRYIT